MLAFPDGGSNVQGFVDAGSLISGTCGVAMQGGERVYTFNQAVTGPFIMTVAPSQSSGTLRPQLYVRNGCTMGPDLACVTAPTTDFTARTLSIASLAAGSHQLVVDSVGTNNGPYTLTAYQGVQPGDSCGSAQPRTVDLSAATSVIFAGDTTSLGSDTANFCSGTSGNDVVYTFIAPRNGILTVYARGTFDITLEARVGPTCATAINPAADGGNGDTFCSDNDGFGTGDGHELLNVSVTTGTTYWFWIVGYDDPDYGAYQIQFTLP